MPGFDLIDKPAEGWTRAFGLPTGDVSFEDSVSPDFFEDERIAVFGRSWLCVGRVESISEPGSYATKELSFMDVSVLLVRGRDFKVRAFHNMCRHRGNKLVRGNDTDAETTGSCRQFMCPFHGWRYDLDGRLRRARMPEWFFELNTSEYGLKPIACEIWEGFIFVCLADQPDESLDEFLGELGAGLSGYPFDAMSERYGFVGSVASNWKLLEDTFQETYHLATLHHRLSSATKRPVEASPITYFELLGRHSVESSVAPLGKRAEPRPSAQLLEADIFGPWTRPDLPLTELPKYVNPTKHEAWASTVCHLFPNMEIFIFSSNTYATHNYWPIDVNTHRVEINLYYVPPANASERIAHEYSVVAYKEFALQDVSTAMACQRAIRSQPATSFPLCDEEVQVRNNHLQVQAAVASYRRARPAGHGS